MLIKLNGLAHPELNGGKPFPVYVDASRIICINRSAHQQIKLLNAEVKREVYDDLYSGAARLAKMVNEQMPMTIDNEHAAKWQKDVHNLCHEINDSYQAWGRAYRTDDYYPKVECTEIQLACGTALEHGVMLARVWVSDPIEEVAKAIREADPKYVFTQPYPPRVVEHGSDPDRRR